MVRQAWGAAACAVAMIVVLTAVSGCREMPEDAGTAAEADTPDARDARDDTSAVDTVDEADSPALAVDSVRLVFTRGEAPAPVQRAVSRSSADLETALELLVRGPSPEERAAGISSWFSDETAGVLRSVEVDAEGNATVDFEDLRRLIPNASTSAGSAILMHELNGTAFQFPEIRSVTYTIEGSCELFWEWLQTGCHVVERPENPRD